MWQILLEKLEATRDGVHGALVSLLAPSDQPEYLVETLVKDYFECLTSENRSGPVRVDGGLGSFVTTSSYRQFLLSQLGPLGIPEADETAVAGEVAEQWQSVKEQLDVEGEVGRPTPHQKTVIESWNRLARNTDVAGSVSGPVEFLGRLNDRDFGKYGAYAVERISAVLAKSLWIARLLLERKDFWLNDDASQRRFAEFLALKPVLDELPDPWWKRLARLVQSLLAKLNLARLPPAKTEVRRVRRARCSADVRHLRLSAVPADERHWVGMYEWAEQCEEEAARLSDTSVRLDTAVAAAITKVDQLKHEVDEVASVGRCVSELVSVYARRSYFPWEDYEGDWPDKVRRVEQNLSEAGIDRSVLKREQDSFVEAVAVNREAFNRRARSLRYRNGC